MSRSSFSTKKWRGARLCRRGSWVPGPNLLGTQQIETHKAWPLASQRHSPTSDFWPTTWVKNVPNSTPCTYTPTKNLNSQPLRGKRSVAEAWTIHPGTRLTCQESSEPAKVPTGGTGHTTELSQLCLSNPQQFPLHFYSSSEERLQPKLLLKAK